MILDRPLTQFVISWLLIIILITLLSLLPFIVRQFYPQAYRGFWRVAGDLLKSPWRALMTPLGMVLGLILAIIIFYERQMTVDTMQNLFLLILFALLTLGGILLSWRLYSLERDRDR